MSPTFRLQPDASGLGMTSQRARDRLIQRLRDDGGIRNEQVLSAMRMLPRHLFIDEALASRAYEDTALPIGCGQTISQPWAVARMTEALLEYGTPQRVLEVGTGSGYQAAVLSMLIEEVYTVERIDELLRQARRRFRKLGIGNIRARHDDGRIGWADAGPFDAIIVTAAAAATEPALIDQLTEGGVLVAPVGSGQSQQLLRLRKLPEGISTESLGPVVFVPLLAGVT